MSKTNIRKRVFNYFQMAALTAIKREDERSFLLGAVGIRYDGALVKSVNASSFHPVRTGHAEARLCKKLDVGSIVYVVRVKLLDGSLATARPCKSCQKILRSTGVSKVYYSISEFEYGIMTFNNKAHDNYVSDYLPSR